MFLRLRRTTRLSSCGSSQTVSGARSRVSGCRKGAPLPRAPPSTSPLRLSPFFSHFLPCPLLKESEQHCHPPSLRARVFTFLFPSPLFFPTSVAGPSKVFGTNEINKEKWVCSSGGTLRGHTEDVLDVAWSPAGTQLASCSIDNTVRIWDAVTFANIQTLRGHEGHCKGVVWDPVGTYLASQGDDKRIVVWETHSWTKKQVVTEPFQTVKPGSASVCQRLAWTSDGGRSKPPAYIQQPRICSRTLVEYSDPSVFSRGGEPATFSFTLTRATH